MCSSDLYLPALRPIFHTAPLGPAELLFLLPFPFVVWGADEMWRWRRRRCRTTRGGAATVLGGGSPEPIGP